MKLPQSTHEPGKYDYLIASIIFLLSLAAYVRTLAPDILYGDSAEFQCLAYTLGITHSTGYPTYLFLGRLIGFLPVGNPAWRISLFSALCAAFTVGGVYLLARNFTRSRTGASLGSLALGISYTFWSQAVIAEVYTPGMAFIVAVSLLLFRWGDEPRKRNLCLFSAALLAGIGFGVHASVWLIALPATAFVLLRLANLRASRPEWVRALSTGLAGSLAGLTIFLVAFLVSDRLNSPTSFIRTTLEPSRVFWNLQPEDFASSLSRLKMTVVSAQWGNALFPGGDFSFRQELINFISWLAHLEFPPLVLLFALFGYVAMLLIHPIRGSFFLFSFLFSLFFILNYQVGDKYVFYLSLYIPLAVAAGVGMGSVLEWVHYHLEPLQSRGAWFLYLLPVLFFTTMVLQPNAASRWQALKDGVANFVAEEYAFPVRNLEEPRFVAQRRLAGMADNAVYVLDWRALFTTAYLAQVEKGMTDTLFFEAMPYGNNGKVASTLISQLAEYLEAGRPVYADFRYPGLEEVFRLMPTSGNLYKVSLR